MVWRTGVGCLGVGVQRLGFAVECVACRVSVQYSPTDPFWGSGFSAKVHNVFRQMPFQGQDIFTGTVLRRCGLR